MGVCFGASAQFDVDSKMILCQVTHPVLVSLFPEGPIDLLTGTCWGNHTYVYAVLCSGQQGSIL